MKTKKKVVKTKKEVMAKVNTVDTTTDDEDAVKVPVVQEIKIASFSGEFGRQDINSLRDKVNEIIDYINKQ